MSANRSSRVAVIYGTVAGVGGLGHSVAGAITSLAGGQDNIVALGPGAAKTWSLEGGIPRACWLKSPDFVPRWRSRYTPLRWNAGLLTYLNDVKLGKWAAMWVAELQPDSCYMFTQVALETLQWARAASIPTVLDNPNGHIRNFYQVCERESVRWMGKGFHGHPTEQMVRRVEEEYRLADRIRVYSQWAKQSMTAFGVPEAKVHVIHQPVNLHKFQPASKRRLAVGPLRVCYVGSLDLRKGFVYLLRAIKAVGPDRIRLRIVGSTGDRACARLFRREAVGLQIQCEPGDPLPVYQDSELLVVPSLEDGFPFVLVEGMSCGLAVIATDQAGASECIRNGNTGWIIPGAEVEPLTSAFENALQSRSQLEKMGIAARHDVATYAGPLRTTELCDWYYSNRAAEISA
jgi:glycosyltransferase involved in cell wall biosynthesis